MNVGGLVQYRRVFSDGPFWESVGRESEGAGRSHGQSPALLASVKDSARFAGGWGFFDFTGPAGRTTSKALALLDSSGCRSCHRQEAETDHVFTQFYPGLRAARQGARLAGVAPRSTSTEGPAVPRPSRFQPPFAVAHA